MAPARAGEALAKLRSQQLLTEAPPDAASRSALKALVSSVKPVDEGMRFGLARHLSAVLEEAITVTDDWREEVDASTHILCYQERTALLIDVLEGNTTLPGLSALVPECEGDCGGLHAAALLHLRADALARRGDFCGLLALAELPGPLRSGVASRCCFHHRVFMYLTLGCVEGQMLETVAAGGLEFAAQTLESFPNCNGAALSVARYVGLAGGQGQEHRALQTGMLPHLITFLKETIKRAGQEEEDDYADAVWASVSQAFMVLAGCCSEAKPHIAGGSAKPQVVEELIKAGLPRLCMSRAVALAQRAHDLAKPPEKEDDGWLTTELRTVGQVFCACVLLAATPQHRVYRDSRLFMTLVAALRANAHLDMLQLWALRYCFVPLAYAEITRKKGGKLEPAFVRAGCRACRLKCCAPLRSMGNAPETLAVLHTAGALPVVLAAAEQHRCCRRSAARLLAYLTQGDFSARRLLGEFDASAVMLRIHAEEQPRLMPLQLLDQMRQLDAHPDISRMRLLSDFMWRNKHYPDTDAVEPPQEDGCSLSEGDFEDDGFGSFTENSEALPLEEILNRAQENSRWYVERMKILTRAVCALTDAPDVKSASLARAAATADDIMAELLAEEEAEKEAAAKAQKKKKKSKKKSKGAKAKAAVEDSEASDGDDEEEMAEAVGVETLVAGVTRATLAPPPPPFRSPAAAAAAQPPPLPSVTKPKPSKAKQFAATTPAAKTSKPTKAEALPFVALPPFATPMAQAPMLPPMAQVPMLPPLPPLQSQASLHSAPPLPPLPLARASSAVDELFPWLAQGSPPSEPAGPFADVAHEDDGLCVVCLDEQRSTALPGCADAHPPVLCAGCVALLRHGNAPACPLCRAPLE